MTDTQVLLEDERIILETPTPPTPKPERKIWPFRPRALTDTVGICGQDEYGHVIALPGTAVTIPCGCHLHDDFIGPAYYEMCERYDLSPAHWYLCCPE